MKAFYLFPIFIIFIIMASVSASEVNLTDELTSDVSNDYVAINDNEDSISLDDSNSNELSVNNIDDECLSTYYSNVSYSFADDSWVKSGDVVVSDDGSNVTIGHQAYISVDIDFTDVEKIEFRYMLSKSTATLKATIGSNSITTGKATSWTSVEYDTSDIKGNQTLKFSFISKSQYGYVDSLVLTFNYDHVEPINIITYVDSPVNFNYTATGSVDKWYWDFGDGNVSNESNPSHSYNKTGIYNANLTMTTGDNSDVVYYVVKVIDKPIANFTFRQNSVNSYGFYDASSGSIINYTLDFGDGNEVVNFTSWPYGVQLHSYSNVGYYSVTLTVTDILGNTSIIKKENIIKIYNYITHTVDVDSFEDDEEGWDLNDTVYRTFDQSIDGNASIHIEVSSVQENMFVMKKELDLDNIDLITVYGRTISSDKGSSSSSKIYMYIDDTQVDGHVSIINFNTWHSNTFDVSSFFGTHNVTLTAYIIPGSGVWIDNIKYQNYQNIANFTVSTPKVENNEVSITFTDKSTGIISGYLWEFDDGTNTTSRNPTHTFGQGNHSVTLHIYHDGVEVDNCTYEFSLSLPTIAGTGVSYSSVQDAISNSSENDVINIDPGMVFVENLVIDKNLTLNFNGAILQSKDSANPVFSVTDGATVIIKDVGLNQNSIFATSNDSKLIIRDSDINVNLNLNEGNIDLINNTFNNVGLTLIADTNIYNSTINAGKLTVKGYVIVNDSTISNNCILNVIDDANMILSNSDIIDSKIVSESGNLTVENVTFDNTYLTLTNNCSINNVNIENSGVIVNGGKSKITKSNLTNCNVAITQTAGELELTNNIIKNNNNAINITGGSATISYNAIYNNTGDLNLTGATVTNNWFGTNQVTGYDSYLRLVLTSVDSEMYSGNEYTIKVEFVPNTGSMDGALNDLTFDFTSTNGEITSPIVISDNQGELKFTAGAVSDEVKFTLLSEEYSLVNEYGPVSIVAKPLDTSLSIESTEKGSIVITLKDSDGNAISGANVNYTINGGETLSNVTDANGKFTINDLTGSINIVANYTGNKTYNPTNNAKSFDFKLNTGMIIANESKIITITLKDENGKAVVGANVNYTINGGKTLSNVTDANGKFTISDLPDEYIEIKFNYPGDDTYNANVTSMNFNFTVPQKENTTNNTSNATNTNGNGGSTNTNTQTTTTTAAKTVKVASKIVAKKKTFKVKTKTKKYKITLKTKSGKAIKKVKVTLKVKGKTYKAKTNAKGVATFKITKLNKKGKYTAKIKFAGNKSYKATSKKIKLTVKK